MYKSLYEISADYASIVNDLVELDGEITPELEFALQINKEELEKKAEAYALRIIEFLGQAELLKAEKERLDKRQKHFENTAKRLQSLIGSAMTQFQVERIKTERVTLSFRKSEACNVPDDFASLLQFVTIKAEINKEKIDQVKESITDEKEREELKIPTEDLLEYFKLSAAVDTAKIKGALKEGTKVGECTIVQNKSLQVK